MRHRRLGTGEPGWHPLRKLRTILRGTRYAVLEDFAVAYKLVLALVVLVACVLYRPWLDVSVVLLATGAMLAAEMFNTAVEVLCDFVQPRDDPRIGAVKDIAAAATGVSILVWVLVMAGEAVELVRTLTGSG